MPVHRSRHSRPRGNVDHCNHWQPTLIYQMRPRVLGYYPVIFVDPHAASLEFRCSDRDAEENVSQGREGRAVIGTAERLRPPEFVARPPWEENLMMLARGLVPRSRRVLRPVAGI